MTSEHPFLSHTYRRREEDPKKNKLISTINTLQEFNSTPSLSSIFTPPKMGSTEDDHFQKKHHQPNKTKYMLKLLLIIISTNLLTIYIFTGPLSSTTSPSSADSTTTILLRELNHTQTELTATRSQAANLNRQLQTTNKLVETLVAELIHIQQTPDPTPDSVSDENMSEEVQLATGSHKLPLGTNSRTGIDIMYPSVGGACWKFPEELAQYMDYKVGGECPTDDVFAQKLLMKGCEPLPRRRCRSKSPIGYTDPKPLPESLWSTPSDTSIIWEPYTCKSYKCLIDRKNAPGFYDCKDCFDLNFREKSRWMFDKSLDYGIDKVIATKPKGTIRIGLDIGGGPGTFAARMKERNVTIITSSMNLDGPFNSFIASRGLIPLHLSVSERLPFFDNTLDIVHSMHIMSNWIPDMMLEFTMYDVFRILRPGGLFWLDHFFCFGSQMNSTYVPMLDRVGFKRLRWNVGKKLDKGKDEWYFSALLEKPMT
ncbi:probable methyltransferase At1g29790 [Impatiens glandulifera]|uniref:probable methyltransferase At1g29790 n=1 Tax=Impatiens glandulifera TaxID=253017 RepID=UPI001FB127DC|nr:probable methyltransferase At1g29790 [Impatiens glandulifera]